MAKSNKQKIISVESFWPNNAVMVDQVGMHGLKSIEQLPNGEFKLATKDGDVTIKPIAYTIRYYKMEYKVPVDNPS